MLWTYIIAIQPVSGVYIVEVTGIKTVADGMLMMTRQIKILKSVDTLFI